MVQHERALRQGNGLLSRSTATDGSTSSPFFKLLSLEIRYQAYHVAFGNRVLHLYLLYCRSLNSDVGWRRGHYPKLVPNDSDQDQTETPDWRWWNCLCGPQKARFDSRTQAYCPGGFFQLGNISEMHLGVMGWLLSCRRAYDETIEMLYRSNTFKLDRRLEAIYLPFCLTKWQLSLITSLEIRIPERDGSLQELDSIPQPGKPRTDLTSLVELGTATKREQYMRIIQFVEDNFPALKRFHLSLEGSVRGVPVPQASVTTLSISTLGHVEPSKLESVVLGPIDALPSKIERQLMLFQSLYTAVLSSARKRGEVVEELCEEASQRRHSTKWRRMRFWRPLKGEIDGVKRGYWIYSHV